MPNITCCENKNYLAQISDIIKGNSEEELEFKYALFNIFATCLLSQMEQDKKNCEKCSNFLKKILNENFEVEHREVERSHDEEGNPIKKN